MTVLTVEVLQDGPVEVVEVLHPGPRGLNAFDIDGGSASTVYGGAVFEVIDGGDA